MLLTIYNLPENTRYLDVKSLIESKCGISDMILDNLISWGSYMKVTVGLASEEDAAILVRKVNGLFVNGTQLHVEDVRKKKQATEQPYYNTTRNISYQNHQNEPAYMGQPNDQPRYQANKETNIAPLLTFYQSTLGPYTPNAPLVQQNVYAPYGGQPAVQYPTPQRMYQAPNQPEQEPLGFRSEGTANPWSHNQGRDHEPPKSFSQRDIRWSPERGQRNRPRSSRWGDVNSDRDGERRKSPPRDRRPHERDQPDSSRKSLRSQAWALNRENFHTSDNRGPQRPNDRFFKDNRNPQAPLSKDRQFERAPFSNPKPAKNNEQRRPNPTSHQPWAKPNSGSVETQNWKEQSNKPARKRNLEQDIEERPKRARLPTLKEFTKSTKGRPKQTYTNEEYKKVEALRSETWRAQTASQIAKDMIDGKTISGVEHNAFFKELKRVLRERLAGLCQHPKERHDGLYQKYRKKFKEEDDEKFIQEVVESVNLVKAAKIERSKKASSEKAEASGDVKHEKPDIKPAQTPSDVKVPMDSKPLSDADGTFKIPLVPKLKTETAMADDKEPKYTKTELFKFKLQKQQTKRIFNHESNLLKSLDLKHADALEAESNILLEKFLEGCHDPDLEEKVLFKRLTTTVAEDFKRVVKVNVARRMTNFDQPIVRVFCSPKMLGRAALSQFLEGQGITAIKKASKHPMMLAACQNYEVHDRLCTAEPFQIQDRTISFKPLQIAGPPVKVTRERINEQRKKFIESQIENTDDDDEMKLMNDIQEFQQNLEDEIAEKNETKVESGSNKTNKIKEEKQSPNNSIDNIPIEDFTDDVDVVFAQKDISVDDYKIVEDTIGNFNNKERIEDFTLEAGNMGDGEEATEHIDTRDVQDGGNDTSDVQDGGNDTSDVQDVGNTDHIDENGGNVGEDEGNMDDSEEQVQDVNAVDNDCEDVDIGDIDEDDLEDY